MRLPETAHPKEVVVIPTTIYNLDSRFWRPAGVTRGVGACQNIRPGWEAVRCVDNTCSRFLAGVPQTRNACSIPARIAPVDASLRSK